MSKSLPVFRAFLVLCVAVPTGAAAQKAVDRPLPPVVVKKASGASASSAFSAEDDSKAVPSGGLVVVETATDLETKTDAMSAKIGRGVNTLSSLLKRRCLNGRMVAPAASSSSVDYTMELVKSAEQFDRQTTVEASLSTGWGTFSADVKAKLDQSVKTNKHAEFLLIRETVRLPPINFRGMKGGDPTLALPVPVDEATTNSFLSQCGDEYVSELVMGGEFLAFLSFSFDDEATATKFESSFGASGLSTKFSASVSVAVNTASQNSRANISYHRIGGKGDNPDDTLDGFAAYAKKFPSDIYDHDHPEAGAPAVVGYVSEPYATVGVTLPDTHNAKENLANLRHALDLASRYQLDLGIYKTRLDALSIPDPRAPMDGDLLTKTVQAQAQTKALLRRLKSAEYKCSNYFWVEANCTFPDELTGYKPVPLRTIYTVHINPKFDGNQFITRLREGTATFTTRGRFCWDGDYNVHCTTDGTTSDPGVYLVVNGQRYRGQPLLVEQGDINVRVFDPELSDNSGDDFTAVVY